MQRVRWRETGGSKQLVHGGAQAAHPHVVGEAHLDGYYGAQQVGPSINAHVACWLAHQLS